MTSEIKKPRIVAIDFDTPVYAIGFKTEGEPVENALHSVKVFIDKIVTRLEADHYILFLTGKDNFRNDIATIQPYKGNRAKNRKPEHYQAIRDYAIKYHGAVVVDGAEADDALGIFLTTPDNENVRIVASIDKDLNGVPGLHYNWNNDTEYMVSKDQALYFFLDQIITGDSTDNIPGLYKITGRKATKSCKGYAAYDSVLWQYKQAWKEKHGDSISKHQEEVLEDQVAEVANLLWIRRYNYEGFGDYMDDHLNRAGYATVPSHYRKLLRVTK